MHGHHANRLLMFSAAAAVAAAANWMQWQGHVDDADVSVHEFGRSGVAHAGRTLPARTQGPATGRQMRRRSREGSMLAAWLVPAPLTTCRSRLARRRSSRTARRSSRTHGARHCKATAMWRSRELARATGPFWPRASKAMARTRMRNENENEDRGTAEDMADSRGVS